MRITIVQSTVLEGKDHNINHICDLLKEELETDMIVLPEMFISPYDNDKFSEHSVTPDDKFFTSFKNLSIKHNCLIIAGSVPEKVENKLYNTTFVFDRGELVTKYQKIHLFKVTYPDGTTYSEDDVLTDGKDIVVVDTSFGKIGLMICFDIRFPYLAEALRKKGAKLLVVPAAFNTYTGPMHWELAFRSRAVDNQLYTLGVSPSTKSVGAYNYYGHSILCDPLGNVLYDAFDKESVYTIDIDLNEVEKVREILPITKNEKKLIIK